MYIIKQDTISPNFKEHFLFYYFIFLPIYPLQSKAVCGMTTAILPYYHSIPHTIPYYAPGLWGERTNLSDWFGSFQLSTDWARRPTENYFIRFEIFSKFFWILNWKDSISKTYEITVLPRDYIQQIVLTSLPNYSVNKQKPFAYL